MASTAAADNVQYRTVQADREAAAFVLMKLSDFRPGTGWKGGVRKPDRSPDPSCPGTVTKLSDLVVTGDAKTAFTYRGGLASVDTWSAVFRTTEMLEKYWQRGLGDRGAAGCLRGAFAKMVQPDARLVSFTKLPLSKVGSHSVGYRLRVHFNKGFDMLFDVIETTRGRMYCDIGTTMRYSAESPSSLLSVDRHVIDIVSTRMAVA